MASRDYVYNTRDAANFAAFAPISWCLIVAWIIFVSYIGQAGMYGNPGSTCCWLWSFMILDTSVPQIRMLYALPTYQFLTSVCKA